MLFKKVKTMPSLKNYGGIILVNNGCIPQLPIPKIPLKHNFLNNPFHNREIILNSGERTV